jgi:hypothetical protein
VDSSGDQQHRAWQHVWEALTYQEKILLSRLLRIARIGDQPSERDAQDWKPLVAKLDSMWSQRLTEQNRNALLTTTHVDPEQKRALLEELTNLETMWTTGLQPALAAATQPQDWTDEQRAALAKTERTLDAIALAEVRDDTVWRPDERTAWFRLLESLQATDPAALERQSLGQVDFVQIFRQSQEYRGRVVTVRGTARMTYRVGSPANDLGIRDYYLFWIQPDDGTNLPIVVYALNPPAGFPTVTTEQQKIHEQLEVTGYFFKRWVYRAADGLNSVPLIVAAAPQWLPRAPPPETTQQRLATALGAYFWPVVAVGIAAILAAACGIAWLVHWSSRPSPALAGLRAAESPAWDQLPDTSSVEESLRKLEDRPEGE